MGRARVLRAPERTMIAIADAGYSITRSDTAWLEGVLEAARPLLDHGGFIHGYLVDAKARTFRSAAAIQLPEGADFEKHVRHAHPPTGDADIAHAARAANLVTSSAIYGLTGPALAARCFFPDGFGVEDCIALSAADPSGIACMLMGGLPFVGRVAHRDQTRWAHVASHLGAALRLRERLLAAPEEVGLDAADALLDPRTLRVQHGTADTEAHRAAIRSAAELLSARHRGDDAAKLIAAWRALVAGRWSLIDTFDTDGKRFFVLRKNEPTAPGPPLLSPVQRAISAYVAMGHSNKAIAYHLGLSESSISRAVAEVCKVLGVPSRAQLAQLAGALGAHPEGADA